MFLSSALERAQKRWHEPDGYKMVLKVGLPLVASMASSTIMQFTDRLFLSHYSLDAIAASAPAGMPFLLVLLTLMGVAEYSGVFIAQFVGAQMPERVGRILWQALCISFVGAGIFILISFFSEALFALGGHEAKIQAMEAQYFRILCLGGGLPLITAALSCFFSGRGRTRPIMIANIVAALVNIPMDYVLIFGKFGFPVMGIAGAAVATVLGWCAGLLVIACLVFRPKYEARYKVWSSRGLDIPLLRRILRYGIAGGLEYFLEFVGYTMFVFLVGSLGATPLAVSNIISSISTLGFLPCLGLHTATSALVGQAMGRKNLAAAERVTGSALHLAVLYMGTMALLFVIIPGLLLDIFRPGGMSLAEFEIIKAEGRVILYFLAVYYIADAFTLIYYGCLKGSGDVWFVMFSISFGALCLVLGSLASLHFFPTSLRALWVVFSLYIVLLAFISWARFKSGGWKKKRILEGLAE